MGGLDSGIVINKGNCVRVQYVCVCTPVCVCMLCICVGDCVKFHLLGGKHVYIPATPGFLCVCVFM